MTMLTDFMENKDAAFPPPREFQEAAHTMLRSGARAGHRCQILMAPTGAGKCLGVDTPILMADGTIKPVQNVVAGDKLIGPDGLVRNVLSVAAGREMLYRITPMKGDGYVVNASHILSMRKTGSEAIILSNGSRIEKNEDVVNVNVEVLAASNKTAKHCLKGWRSSELEFPCAKEPLLIDPYILGSWLGDGNQRHPEIAKPYCKMVEAWKLEAERLGHRFVSVKQKEGKCPIWRISSDSRDENGYAINHFTRALDFYGLRQKKHVPQQYKIASVSDRLKLIAGLLDSDGHLSHSGYDWISNREWLAEDFAFLCRSVGLAAYVAKCEKRIKSIDFVGTYWRVHVSGDTERIPCLDKVAAPRMQKKRHLVHGISIEKIGIGDYFGFEIDGDGLFLLGDFTVTHNTYLGMRAVHEALLKNKRAMFVCDRTALIDQTSAVADSYGIPHGIIQANHWRSDSTRNFQIASVQTLARRNWPYADLIVVDECHTQYKSWVDHVKNCGAHAIGLSATPFSDGLGTIFTNLVNAATMNELVQSGILVPMRVLSSIKPDMTGAKTVMGEWSDKEAEARGMEIIGDVVAEWITHASNMKTIVFGSTIRHCEEMCAAFNASGIISAVYTTKTQPEERRSLLEEFSKSDSAIRVLISVEALAKGFDVKDIECVVDARPLRKSISTFIQMIGRGLRSSPGKKECLILDHSGNIIRFKEDFEDIYFNGLKELDDGKRLDKSIRKEPDDIKEPKGCPKCGSIPFFKRCIVCGYEKPLVATVEHLPGVMREVMIGKHTAAANKGDLWAQICTYVRGSGKVGEAAQKRACGLYRDITNEWPPMSWRVPTAPYVEPTAVLRRKIQSLNIAWAAVKLKKKAG